MLEEQIWYFRLVILLVLAAASMLMTMVSRFLTRHLELLAQASGEIARENYAKRVRISSEDEVGQLAEQFNHMADAVEDHIMQLREMIQSREQFVAGFTHEIKTPMTAIIGYADTMRSMELPRQEQVLALNYIFSEGKRLEDMSGKLFELLCLKRTEIECIPVHVTDLITGVVRTTKPILEKKEIVLVHNVEEAVIKHHKLCGDGPFTHRCSEWLEQRLHTPKALLTTSCTHATEMAALLSEIKEGDEIGRAHV